MYMGMSKKESLSYSIARLRSRLARAIRQAEAGRTVEITRRGRPVAVLVGRDDLERLRQGGDFWERYVRFRESADLASLDIDPDDVFGDLRDDPSPGREVSW